ncbi:MAG: adenylosuccinate lyase [Acidimicrobiaceae bacterium]|nr:adenylosuccinate lyase [Acidimicrobiaceae bacterium]
MADTQAVNTDVPHIVALRYASQRMQSLWTPEHKVVLERRFWVAVLKAQKSLGFEVPEEAIADYEAAVHDVDLESITAREVVTRHDVKARIEEFCDLAGHEYVHCGMTSRDLTENVEQLQILESLKVIRSDLVMLIGGLADSAEKYMSLVMTGRTHNVAAQAVTLGKRFADAASEAIIGFERIVGLMQRYPLRGIKGPVGTQLDQLDLLGTSAAVAELEKLVAEHCGFTRVLPTSAQVYPRSLDLDVVAALVQVVSAPASLTTTVRLMAGHDLVSEGSRDGQVGSSAMPHKVNARSCERVAALKTVLDGYLAMAASLSGRQWNEGDVSCSAARRVMLPDAFLAADGLLHTTAAVLEDLRVSTKEIEAEFNRDLPKLITTRLLGAFVAAGMGREAAHRLLSEYTKPSTDAAVSPTADVLQLVDRLAADSRTPLSHNDLVGLVATSEKFTGRAVEQVCDVVKRSRAIEELHPEAADQRSELRL